MGWNPIGDLHDSLNDAIGGVADTVGDVADAIGDIGHAVGEEIQRLGRDFNDEWNRLVGKIFPQPDIDDILKQFEGLLLNHDGATRDIPVIYGQALVGGVRAAPPIVTGGENEYVHLVIIHGEGPIGGYVQHYLDDVPITNSRFSGLYRLKTYTGAPGQTVDPDALAEIPGWTSNHRFEGMAYSYLRLRWDKDAFSRLPTLTTLIQGRELYDPRSTLSAYSRNPALMILDYLTHPIYGKGIPLARINQPAFAAAADHYDTRVQQYAGGPNVARGLADGVLDTGREILRNLRQMTAEFGCELIEPKTAGAQWSIVVHKDEASEYSFTTDNIFGRISITDAGRRARYNRVAAKLRDSARDWQAVDAVYDSPALRAEDNGRVLETQVPLQYTADMYQAQRIIERAVKVSRQQLGCAFLTDLGVLKITEGSIVDVTHPDYGWDGKLFRLARPKLLNDGTVMVTLAEHEPTAYDETIPPEQPTPPDTNLPDPWSVAPPTTLLDASGTAHLLLQLDGTVVPRVFLSWTAPADAFVTGYVVEYKRSSDSTWIAGGSPSGRTNTSTFLTGLQEGELYDYRVMALNANGVQSAAAERLGRSVVGKSEPPPDVDTFLVQRQPDGTREFSWALLSKPLDLDGYEIRFAPGTETDWSAMTPLHDGVLTSSPYETNQLAAGEYTFAIKTFDTSGNESAVGKFITLTVGNPRLRNALIIADPRSLGWPGTKTACSVDTTGALVPDSTDTWATLPATWDAWTSWINSPVASMSYQHPTIDLGAVLNVTPLVSATAAGTVTLEERHSDDDVTYSAWAPSGTPISARYIQVRITVTSPTAAGVTQMQIIIDAETLRDELVDVDTSTLTGTTGDRRLPPGAAFSVITRVALTLQNTGPGWTWELIDKNVASGPRVKIYNASGVLADAVIDAEIVGA